MSQLTLLKNAKQRIAMNKGTPQDKFLVDTFSRLSKVLVERNKLQETLAQAQSSVRELSFANDCLESRIAKLQGQAMPILPLEDEGDKTTTTATK
jgi:hypothetical protein